MDTKAVIPASWMGIRLLSIN